MLGVREEIKEDAGAEEGEDAAFRGKDPSQCPAENKLKARLAWGQGWEGESVAIHGTDGGHWACGPAVQSGNGDLLPDLCQNGNLVAKCSSLTERPERVARQRRCRQIGLGCSSCRHPWHFPLGLGLIKDCNLT